MFTTFNVLAKELYGVRFGEVALDREGYSNSPILGFYLVDTMARNKNIGVEFGISRTLKKSNAVNDQLWALGFGQAGIFFRTSGKNHIKLGVGWTGYKIDVTGSDSVEKDGYYINIGFVYRFGKEINLNLELTKSSVFNMVTFGAH